jgi:hypothetical protein
VCLNCSAWSEEQLSPNPNPIQNSLHLSYNWSDIENIVNLSTEYILLIDSMLMISSGVLLLYIII